jgi:hypothetical protein
VFLPEAHGAKGDGTTDDTAAIQAAINAASAAGGGTVYFGGKTYISKQLSLLNKVNLKGAGREYTTIQLANSQGTSLITSAEYASNINNGSGSAYGANGTPSYFNIEDLTLNGNQVNQPAPGTRTDYDQASAVLQLWGYHMVLRNLEITHAKELALYTEHTASWETTFNEYTFGESNFENIYIKNYGQVGWVNRGPHDSIVRSVYISSYNADGGTPAYGFVSQSNANYSASGLVAHGLHVWGQHTANSVYLNGTNIIDGFIYAEGCNSSALYMTNTTGNYFDATVGYCVDGIEMAVGSTNNRIRASVQSNVSGSLFKMESASGNVLEQLPGNNPGAAVFDCTAGTYTGGNNSFISAHPYSQTLFLGTPGQSDRVDVVSDNYPEANRLNLWTLPVAGNTVTIGNYPAGGVGAMNLGGLELIATGALFGTTTQTLAYTPGAADYAILANANGAAFTVTLPSAVTYINKVYVIKKIDASAHVVTITTSSSQTIDGATTYMLNSQYQSIQVVSNGTNWYII